MATLIGDGMSISFARLVRGQETLTELMVLEMHDLDVILGMEWLASCHATLS